MQHRTRQGKTSRLPPFRQARQLRSARVAEAEQLGGLVEGLAGRVVQRLAQQFVLTDAGHPHQLGMAARHQQGDEGKVRRIGREEW